MQEAKTVAELPGSEVRHAQGLEAESAGVIVRVPLALLDKNPEQYRTELDPEAIEELASSIRTQGLGSPIAVRRVGDRFQVIFGHRRWAAYVHLFEGAQTDQEREKWRAIPAIDHSGTSDRDMLTKAVIENLQRQDPHDVDTGRVFLRHVDAEGLSMGRVAELYGIDVSKVKRHVRLARAPSVVVHAVGRGLMVQLYDEDGAPRTTPQGRAKQEHRRLDIMSALELTRLHEHWAKDDPKKADRRIADLVDRVLRQSWGFRRIHTHVDAAIKGTAVSKDGSTGRPTSRIEPLPWKDSAKQLVIYKERLASLTDEQRRALRSVVEALLATSENPAPSPGQR